MHKTDPKVAIILTGGDGEGGGGGGRRGRGDMGNQVNSRGQKE